MNFERIWRSLPSLYACILVVVFWIKAGSGQPLMNDDEDRYRDGTYMYRPELNEGMRLGAAATYMIVTPRTVRPGQTLQAFVTLFESHHDFMDITLSIRRDSDEQATVSQRFHTGSSQLMQILMPEDAGPGNYSLMVRGGLAEGYTSYLFENETKLFFQAKQASFFILTDKKLYNKRQWIHFRVVAIRPDLLPVKVASVNIFVKDPGGRICRRWLNSQLYLGYYENKFWVDFPVKFGMWKIEAHALGYVYDTTVKVENWFGTRFDVNLTMPSYILDTEYALSGTIMANLTNRMPVKGNATLQLFVKPSEKDKNRSSRQKRFPDWVRRPADEEEPALEIHYPVFEAVEAFSIPLSRIREAVPDLAGAEITVYVSVNDWYFMENKTAKGSCVVLTHSMDIKFLGGKVRTFKPGAPLNAYIAVHQYDGGKMSSTINRQMTVTRSVTSTSGHVTSDVDRRFLVPDDSVVQYSYTPGHGDKEVRIAASYRGQVSTLVATRHYSKRDHYITLTTSTPNPRVDHYMIFNVETTVYVPEIYYLLVSKGSILAGSTLYMKSNQKTFSLAISRAMVPNCRLVAFCVLYNNGEIMADSLNFHVEGMYNENINVEPNFGQDLSKNTLDLIVKGDPSTFVITSGTDYELYHRGLNPFITQYMLEEELSSYDIHTNTSFKHTWYLEDELLENVYFNAPSFAIDANTTFSFSGLAVFTDADLVRNPISVECNLTKGQLPCFDGQCFQLHHMCDGAWHCSDGADEMGCELADPVIRPNRFTSLDRVQTHYDDTQWLWHKLFTQPTGQMDVTVRVPARPTWWLVSAISLSQTRGLTLTRTPARVYTGQMLSMSVELPTSAFRGEQLGVQVALFNFHTETLEVLVTLRDSEKYRFVHVEDWGHVSSYNPRVSRGDHMIMVLMHSGQTRYVHFPVLPVIIGTLDVTVEVACFFRKQTATKTVSVLVI